MNKTLLSAALIAGFGVAAFAPQAAQAAAATGGTITFGGNVNTSTCSINSGTPNLTVTLPNTSTSSLSTAGAVAGNTGFNIALSGCSIAAAGNVTAYFSSTANVLSDGNLLNTGTASSGVEVQLLNSSAAVMDLSKATAALQKSSTAPVTTSSTSATLAYSAQYYSPTGVIVPGAVASQVSYTVIYP